MTLSVRSISTQNGDNIGLGRFNVLVGPNNCGKSQTLRDIRTFLTTGSSAAMSILDAVDVQLPRTREEVQDYVRFLPHPSNPDHELIRGVASSLKDRHDFAPSRLWITQQLERIEKTRDPSEFLRNLGTFFVAHLDAEGRFGLAAPTESYDTRTETPTNALQAFFDGGKTTQGELREAFKNTFSMDIGLDWAGLRRLYLKVAVDFGEIPDERSKLDDLMKDAEALSDQGDGYRSFAGVVLSMLTFPNRVLLLDEPEAFLHPAQARLLGRWLAMHAQRRTAQVIVASHSADLLWGVVSANAETTVIRLNRNTTQTTYHVVPTATTRQLVESPILSSQPVLDSLFYRGVVVCEGDPDRAIYQATAQSNDSKIGDDILFIHSNGKDAARIPLGLFKSAGTPARAIIDFDVLNSRTILSEIVEALTGEAISQRLGELRDQICALLGEIPEGEKLAALVEAVDDWRRKQQNDFRSARKSLAKLSQNKSKWEQVKRKGKSAFDPERRAIVDEFLVGAGQIGLFVVPCGELESWMELEIAKGPKWNRVALERVRSGDAPAHLREFVAEVVATFNI